MAKENILEVSRELTDKEAAAINEIVNAYGRVFDAKGAEIGLFSDDDHLFGWYDLIRVPIQQLLDYAKEQGFTLEGSFDLMIGNVDTTVLVKNNQCEYLNTYLLESTDAALFRALELRGYPVDKWLEELAEKEEDRE